MNHDLQSMNPSASGSALIALSTAAATDPLVSTPSSFSMQQYSSPPLAFSLFHTHPCIPNTSAINTSTIMQAPFASSQSLLSSQQQQAQPNQFKSLLSFSSSTSSDDEYSSPDDAFAKQRFIRSPHIRWTTADEAIVWQFGQTHDSASKSGQKPLPWSHCQLVAHPRSGTVCNVKYLRMKAKANRAAHQRDQPNHSLINTLHASHTQVATPAATPSFVFSPSGSTLHQEQQQYGQANPLLQQKRVNGAWIAEDQAALWRFGVMRERTLKAGMKLIPWSRCPLIKPNRSMEACKKKYQKMRVEADKTPHQREDEESHFTKIEDIEEKKEGPIQEQQQHQEEQVTQVDRKPKWVYVPVTHNAARSLRKLPPSVSVEWCRDSVEALLQYRCTINSNPDPKSHIGWDRVVMQIQSLFHAFAKWHEKDMKQESRLIYQHLYDTNQLGPLSATNNQDDDVEMSPHEESKEERASVVDTNDESTFNPPSDRSSLAESYNDNASSKPSSEEDIDLTQSSPHLNEEHKCSFMSHTAASTVSQSPTDFLNTLMEVSTSSAPINLHSSVAVIPTPAVATSTSNMNIGGDAMGGAEPSSSMNTISDLTSFNWSQINRNMTHLSEFQHHYHGMVNVIKQMQQIQPFCYHAGCQLQVQDTGLRPIYCDLHTIA